MIKTIQSAREREEEAALSFAEAKINKLEARLAAIRLIAKNNMELIEIVADKNLTHLGFSQIYTCAEWFDC